MEKETTQPEKTTPGEIKKATPQSAKAMLEAISDEIRTAIETAKASTSPSDALKILEAAKVVYNNKIHAALEERTNSKVGTTGLARSMNGAHRNAKNAKDELLKLNTQLETLITETKALVEASAQPSVPPVEDATQIEEQRKLAAEALAKEEQQRLAAEALAKAEQQKLAAEALAKAEQQKLAAEALAKAEQQRLAAEALAKEEREKLAATPEAKYNTALAALKAIIPAPQLKKPLDQLLAHIEALQQKRLEKFEGIDETLTFALTETAALLKKDAPTKEDIDTYKTLANDLEGKPSVGLSVLGGFMLALAIVAALLASTGISLVVVASAAAVSGATGIGGIASFWGGSRKSASQDLVDVANIEAKRVAPRVSA